MTPNSNKKRVKPIRLNQTNGKGLRTFDDIVQSGAYAQPEFHPKPIKIRPDDEKDRLANLMAYGVDPNQMPMKNVETPPNKGKIDRFDELLFEIDERREFLRQMTELGKRREYQQMIEQEIGDKIREMETIDRQRSKVLNEYLNEKSRK